MTEADYQLTVTSVTAIVVAVTGTLSAMYAAQSHKQGQANAAAIAEVKTATDGTNHTLAANLAQSQSANEEVLRTIAASTVTPKPPTP